MSKARLVITAVTVEKRPVSEVARSYGVARSWIYALLERYRAEGEAAFGPPSRRPRTSPRAIPDATVSLITGLRKELAGQGLDAGPQTIAWHLEHHHQVKVSPATVSRYLTRAGLVTPEPAKRPRSSYIRFAAELPNECWQAVAAAGDPHQYGVRTRCPRTRISASPVPVVVHIVCAVAYAIVGASSLAPSGFCDEMRRRTRQTAHGFVSLSGAGR